MKGFVGRGVALHIRFLRSPNERFISIHRRNTLFYKFRLSVHKNGATKCFLEPHSADGLLPQNIYIYIYCCFGILCSNQKESQFAVQMQIQMRMQI